MSGNVLLALAPRLIATQAIADASPPGPSTTTSTAKSRPMDYLFLGRREGK